jgi:predicted HTH domain antitoxin
MTHMTPAGHGVKISVELPAEAVDTDGRSVEELASELRLLWLIERVRSGRISLGKGAELAGMDRRSFMRAMSERGVPVLSGQLKTGQRWTAENRP